MSLFYSGPTGPHLVPGDDAEGISTGDERVASVRWAVAAQDSRESLVAVRAERLARRGRAAARRSARAHQSALEARAYAVRTLQAQPLNEDKVRFLVGYMNALRVSTR
jgi:hypothetical protein